MRWQREGGPVCGGDMVIPDAARSVSEIPEVIVHSIKSAKQIAQLLIRLWVTELISSCFRRGEVEVGTRWSPRRGGPHWLHAAVRPQIRWRLDAEAPGEDGSGPEFPAALQL